MTLASLHREFKHYGTCFMVSAWLVVLLPPLLLTGRAPADIAISLIAVLFLVHSIRTHSWAWLQQNWLRCLLVLWVYMCITSMFAEHIPLALGRSAAWLRYVVGAAALAYWLLPNPLLRKALLKALCICLVFLLFDGFLQYTIGYDVVGRAMLDYGTHLRLTGPFSAPRLGITLVWLTLPAACFMLTAPARTSNRYWLGVAAMALTITLVFVSGERMATLFMLFACLLWMVASPALRGRTFAALVVACVLIAALCSIDARFTTRHVEETGQAVSEFGQSPYGLAWQSAYDVIRANPLIGVGAKHFQSACYAQHGITTSSPTNDIICPMHAHNFYLELLVEYGAIGLGLFLLTCYYWVRLAWPHRHAIRHDAVLSALLVTLLIRFFPLASTASQFAAWTAVPLWLTVSWLIAELHTRETA